MSRRLPILPLCALGAGLALASGAAAQGRPAQRGTPAPVAQQPAEPATPAVEPGRDILRDPAAAIANQTSGISQRQPGRASRPVRAPNLRGVTQRQFRPPQPSVATLPPPPSPSPPPPRRRAAEEDAYAPLGLRVGSVTLRPAITNSVGYDTNPQRIAGPAARGSVFTRHEGELGVQSDWNVHELRGTLRGGYSRYVRERDASRPDGDGTLDLRLDVTRDTRILLETRYRLDTQRPGSPDLNAPVTGRPMVLQYGGSAGVTHDINRLQLTLRGSVDRSDYEDARLTSGAILSQRDRNMTQYGLRARAGYEVTPGFRPFVQGEVDSREFNQRIDSSGYARSSNGVSGRVGTAFELSRLFSGELSVGYQDRAYDDGRLKNLRGVIGEAAILWTPTPLTTVTLRGASELGDTTVPGSSGTTVQRGSLEIAHALRRNVTLTGFGSYGRTDYDGQDLREDFAQIGARLEYKLTRTFSVRASFTHERLMSTAVGSDYTANIAQVGLRVQF